MIVSKTAGLALFSLALAARYAMAVDTCVDLITEVAAIASVGVVSVDADFSCSAQIEIAASQMVTITGPATITIGVGFAGDSFSLFVNDGSLTLQEISFESDALEGNRAVWNTGSLSVEGCSFEGLHGDGTISTILEQGGAVSGECRQEICALGPRGFMRGEPGGQRYH